MADKADQQPDFFRNGSFDPAAAWEKSENPTPPVSTPGTRPVDAVGNFGIHPAPGCSDPLVGNQVPGTLSQPEVFATPPAPSRPGVGDRDIEWARAEYRTQSKESSVTVVLWLVLGIFGVHRMYLGKPVSGIAQFLTGGGFVVWWLADIFLLKSMLQAKNFEICRETALRCGVSPELIAPELFY